MPAKRKDIEEVPPDSNLKVTPFRYTRKITTELTELRGEKSWKSKFRG